jgi:hypothetical protein
LLTGIESFGVFFSRFNGPPRGISLPSAFSNVGASEDEPEGDMAEFRLPPAADNGLTDGSEVTLGGDTGDAPIINGLRDAPDTGEAAPDFPPAPAALAGIEPEVDNGTF